MGFNSLLVLVPSVLYCTWYVGLSWWSQLSILLSYLFLFQKAKCLYYLNAILYILLQCPIILAYPFVGIDTLNELYNVTLLILDYLFVQIEFLNEYPDHKKHFLLVNHTSTCDGYLRPKIKTNSVSIIKHSLFYVPFIGQVFWLLDFIFVKRDDKNSRNNTKDKMIQKINENIIVQVFPQGTRERKKRFDTNEIILKKGSIQLAIENNIPIVCSYHNIGDRVDDEKKCIYTDKKVYEMSSGPLSLPDSSNELPLEQKVDLFYKMIYDEFCRLEKIVTEKTKNTMY